MEKIESEAFAFHATGTGILGPRNSASRGGRALWANIRRTCYHCLWRADLSSRPKVADRGQQHGRYSSGYIKVALSAIHRYGELWCYTFEQADLPSEKRREAKREVRVGWSYLRPRHDQLSV